MKPVVPGSLVCWVFGVDDDDIIDMVIAAEPHAVHDFVSVTLLTINAGIVADVSQLTLETIEW